MRKPRSFVALAVGFAAGDNARVEKSSETLTRAVRSISALRRRNSFGTSPLFAGGSEPPRCGAFGLAKERSLSIIQSLRADWTCLASSPTPRQAQRPTHATSSGLVLRSSG
jgi:hypothetical protein